MHGGRPGRAFLCVCVWLTAQVLPAQARADASQTAALEFFETKVRPVLAEYCYRCHSAAARSPKAGLLLDSRAGLLRGGDNGPAIVPGYPEKSRLVEAIHYRDADLRMPPRGKLPEPVIADLITWVKMGAPWPASSAIPQPATSATFDLARRKREHWAWQPIRFRGLPTVQDQGWARDPVDRFLLAKLAEKRLSPAAAAEKRTLLRRVSFDLIGLPPTPAEIEAFLADPSPQAYERVVDRLLASPFFGERWGRHWLDLVRYAETRGHEFDYPIPNAYQYRDYVIRALNADVPYDQFVLEHLAGDLLGRPRLHPAEGFNESILGTAFWLLNEEVHSPVDLRQDEADRFDNRIDVLGKAFLGLTIACARCHDHKFDAISTRDYYALFGLLEGSCPRQIAFESTLHNRRIAEELAALRERSRPGVQRELAERLRPGIQQTAEYLLAARDVVQKGAQAQDAARSHRVDALRLVRWVECLRRAGDNADDVLAAWTQEARRPAATQAAEDGGTLAVVIDYARPGPADWMSDGISFGLGPVRPGDVAFGTDPERPIVGVFDRGAAVKDPTWDACKPAPGCQNDPEALGKVIRAGRTLRTPTFTLAGGRVFYLVRGTGRAYAAVSQHAMIAGPLHKQLLLPIKVAGGFHWVAHDLTPYQGQRVHVEFTPAEGSDFAVAMVVQAHQLPVWSEPPNRLLARLEESAPVSEARAAAYQHLLLDALERLETDHIRGAADAADYAPLADWLVQHVELFTATTVTGPATREFLAEQAKLTASIRKESHLAPALLDGNGVNEHVFIRGSPKAPGEVVPRRFLEALSGSSPLLGPGSGRLELARQLVDPDRDPFLPRVMVNRIWHHLFGRGLLASVDNFGVLGEMPTHPELLDYLAQRFVQEGWSVKKLIRALVLSSAYRMGSQPDGHADQADPENVLLHRARLRRLEGEVIRDAMLAVSGRLDRRVSGPPVPVYLNDFQDGRGKPSSGPLDGDGRRSIYLAVNRNFLPALLLAFDMPAPASTIGRRSVSNVPAQALILLNDPFVHQQAEVWARRLLAEGAAPRARIVAMYETALGRLPGAHELTACLEFVEDQARMAGTDVNAAAAWADLAHVLFNAKEFIFVN